VDVFQYSFDNWVVKIQDMELLVRVAEGGSMTRAARQLGLTPAAVSAAVGRVEAFIGVRLFERTTRSIHPTEDGFAVLDGCRDVIDRWHQTLEQVQGGARQLSGTVHVSAPADTTYQVLEPAIAEVSAEHPRLQVVVHPSDTVAHLHRDAIDMAIRYGQLPDSALFARRLVTCPSILVASPSYLEEHGSPHTPDDLRDHRVVTLRLSGAAVLSWTLRQAGGAHEVALESPLCGDGFLARRWAIAGRGIARKSLFDVIDDLEEGRLVRVLSDYTSGPEAIHAVFPSRRYLPARVRAVDRAITGAIGARAQRCHRWLEHAAR